MWIWRRHGHVSCVSQDPTNIWNSQTGLSNNLSTEVWAKYKKTLRESTVPGLNQSRVLVQHIGCRDMIEEPLLELKGRRVSRESWGRTCDYWPWDIANPRRLLLRELEGMNALISFFSLPSVSLQSMPKGEHRGKKLLMYPHGPASQLQSREKGGEWIWRSSWNVQPMSQFRPTDSQSWNFGWNK